MAIWPTVTIFISIAVGQVHSVRTPSNISRDPAHRRRSCVVQELERRWRESKKGNLDGSPGAKQSTVAEAAGNEKRSSAPRVGQGQRSPLARDREEVVSREVVVLHTHSIQYTGSLPCDAGYPPLGDTVHVVEDE
ncbi:hypothetical protein DFP72DRAFT_844770 [Ephemerocybe angulata]|uniref:Secreted protein n=1 Tax=Ephemerocybe angulata TaxID=980116 RepID=A0A8H6I7Y8_9AGAR|nr:hypothetical protein DFP72DRAFT_844770 [Tulosesus angulatus]